MRSIYRQFGITDEVLDYAAPVLEKLTERFRQIDETAEYNQLRVIKAMQDAHIGEANLKGTTGYGYDDIGRDGLERVYASYFHTEDALVRPQITCGTHALALALMSNLRPGDVLLSAAGAPYDTLQEVIGIRPSRGSLAEVEAKLGNAGFFRCNKYCLVNLAFADSLQGIDLVVAGEHIQVSRAKKKAVLDALNNYLNEVSK